MENYDIKFKVVSEHRYFYLMFQDNTTNLDRNGLSWDGEWTHALVVVVVLHTLLGVYPLVGRLVAPPILKDAFHIVVPP